jgi:arginase
MDVDLLLVPYDSARRGARMGAGPEALRDAGLTARLEGVGHRVRCTVIAPPADSWHAEVRTAFELAAALSAAVRAARGEGRLPLVLAGNCGAALGVRAGLDGDVRVLWADAHADFNTPETTIGGFLDGMALATLTGRCWTTMAGRLSGFAPVPDAHVWLLGARDLDPLEEAALARSGVRRVEAGAIDEAAAVRLAREVGDAPVYLHLDLDVLDPRDGRANAYAAPDGVSADALVRFCAALARHAPPAAVTLSAYDPAEDVDGRAGRAALRVLDALFGASGPARD